MAPCSKKPFNCSSTHNFLCKGHCDSSKCAPFSTENGVIENVDFLVEQISDYFENNGFKSAQAIMEFMLDKRAYDCEIGHPFRKDEKTPKAIHELTQVVWIISLIESDYNFDDPELAIALAIAHDLGEDYGVKPEELRGILTNIGDWKKDRIEEFITSFDAISKHYGEEWRDNYKAGKFLGKKIDGKYKDEHDYQQGVREDKHASIVKMFDRAHNIMTLPGVRNSKEILMEICKTKVYYEDNFFLPMCNTFFSHYGIYNTMRGVLDAQLKVLRYVPLEIPEHLPNDDLLLEDMPDGVFEDMPAGLHPVLTMAARMRGRNNAPEIGAHCEESCLPDQNSIS